VIGNCQRSCLVYSSCSFDFFTAALYTASHCSCASQSLPECRSFDVKHFVGLWRCPLLYSATKMCRHQRAASMLPNGSVGLLGVYFSAPNKFSELWLLSAIDIEWHVQPIEGAATRRGEEGSRPLSHSIEPISFEAAGTGTYRFFYTSYCHSAFTPEVCLLDLKVIRS